jgi:WD40 repeat protein
MSGERKTARQTGRRLSIHATAGVLLLTILIGITLHEALFADTLVLQDPIVLTGHTSTIRALAFSPDDMLLASASADHTLRLWELRGRVTRFTVSEYTTYVQGVTFSPDGTVLAAASDADEESHPGGAGMIGWGGSKATIVDVNTGKVTARLGGFTNPLEALAFVPGHRLLATAGADDRIRFWDSQTWTECTGLRREGIPSTALSFSPDGSLMAVALVNGQVLVSRLDGAEDDRILDSYNAGTNTVTFSPDGRILAAGGNDEMVRLWDVRTGVQTGTLRCAAPVFCVSFSPDGRLIAAGECCSSLRALYQYGDLRLWDTATGRRVAILRNHAYGASAVAFSHDGRQLASGDCAGVIRVWTMPPGK